MKPFCRNHLLCALTLMLLLAAAVSTTPAAAQDLFPPDYLDEEEIVPANGRLYQFWFTTACANGDPECECDDDIDDVNEDGVIDGQDYDRVDACLAEPDSSGNRVAQDEDGDQIPDIVDPDWTGGGEGEPYAESMAHKLPAIIDTLSGWGLASPAWLADPIFNTRDIWIYNVRAAGYAHPDGSRIEMMAENLKDPSWRGRQTLAHEIVHMVQFAYDAVAGAGSWAVEGQASFVPDNIWPEVDTFADSSFLNKVRMFLADPNATILVDFDGDDVPETAQAQGLLGTSYNGALWWAYATEQAGSEFANTSGVGMDFLRSVYEKGLWPFSTNGWLATHLTLQERLGQGFEQTFWDFTIANYAKDDDLTRLPFAYLDGRDPMTVLRYQDELEGNFTLRYGSVPRNSFNGAQMQTSPQGDVLPVQIGVEDLNALPAYGAMYYEMLLPSPESCPLPTWEALNSTGVPLLHSLLLYGYDSNNDGRNELTELYRHKGGSFVRSVVNNNELSRMTAIVASGAQTTAYSWRVRCLDPVLSIEAPTTTYPAAVGTPTAPGRVQIFLTIKDEQGQSDVPLNLDWTRDFRVTIGGQEATILNGDYVQNQYWLVVETPSIPGAATGSAHDLTVELVGAGVGDTQEDAVRFDVAQRDQMLVLDRSGSMADDEKMTSAQAAARLFIDSTNAGDQLGVASFSDTAGTDFALTQIQDQDDGRGVRAGARDAVDRLAPLGGTSIGAGLAEAQDQLDRTGNLDAQPWIVLLSDGRETTQPNALPVLNQRIVPAGTQVMAFALGNDADPVLMRTIAVRTCGELRVDQCYHVLNNDGQPVAASTAQAETVSAARVNAQYPLTNEIADIYLRMGETMAGRQRLWQDAGDGDAQLALTIAEEGGRDAYFSINWRDPNAPMDVKIAGPRGVEFIPLTDKANHITYFVPELIPGDYELLITGKNEWIASLSARQVSGVEMHSFINTTTSQRKLFLPVQIQASLTGDRGPVTGAAVTATVYRGEDGAQEQIVLRDDGVAPHDDAANDGIYGYRYDRINSQEYHVYTFDITARGQEFTRYQRLTYHPADITRTDADLDGLIDHWQQRYGVFGGDLDPDRDGLTNRQEMLAGISPTLDDTDHGGENDGSELANGRSPHADDDDAMTHVGDLWCEAGDNEIVVHFNARSEFQQMRIYRAELNNPPLALADFSQVAEIDLRNDTTYVDGGVSNGRHYVYRLQPADNDRRVEGRFSRPVHCRPAVDSLPPVSYLAINDGAAETTETEVMLRMAQTYDEKGVAEIAYVKVSNTPDLLSAKWQPFQRELPWMLEPDPETNVARVYVQFLDNAGNVSEETVVDAIRITTDGKSGIAGPENYTVFLPAVRHE